MASQGPSSDTPQPSRPFLIILGSDVTGKKKPTSYLTTLIHAIKGIIGTGIFAMGSAFMSSGLLLGPILLICIALIALHCQHLLIRACVKITDKEQVPVLPSFAETVQYTVEDSDSKWLQKHSKIFGIMTDVFLILAEYGFCVVYFVFVSKHLGEIAAAHGWEQDYRVVLALILIPMWLSTFLGNLKLLMPVSLTANLLMWIGIAKIIYYAFQELPPISERDLVASAERIPAFFGIALFAFGAITFIIPMRMEMENKDAFTSPCGVLNVTMTVSLVFYLLIGIFSFWKWGDKVEGSVFLNLPQEEALAQTAKILISIGVMLTYALHMYIPFEILYPRFYRKWGPFEHPTVIIYIYRSVAVVITYAIANISSNLASFISLVGALTTSVLALLLPALLDLIMLYGNLTYLIIFKDAAIIIISIAGAITGTILAIFDIYKEYA